MPPEVKAEEILSTHQLPLECKVETKGASLLLQEAGEIFSLIFLDALIEGVISKNQHPKNEMLKKLCNLKYCP
ncbi:hypothetical protein [Leptolyngbya sp. GGD]|uniref:hypothetical protein n=1 Tax=Leptolyngbya sp. GGD TaxID=2997907 RepID=UPI00227AF706|nr:hypothetical protein [Leptolyngbya sp. GGD]MCY6490252.1 hypothetical protein [Leptolyngbya sp. GGD]